MYSDYMHITIQGPAKPPQNMLALNIFIKQGYIKYLQLIFRWLVLTCKEIQLCYVCKVKMINASEN